MRYFCLWVFKKKYNSNDLRHIFLFHPCNNSLLVFTFKGYHLVSLQFVFTVVVFCALDFLSLNRIHYSVCVRKVGRRIAIIGNSKSYFFRYIFVRFISIQRLRTSKNKKKPKKTNFKTNDKKHTNYFWFNRKQLCFSRKLCVCSSILFYVCELVRMRIVCVVKHFSLFLFSRIRFVSFFCICRHFSILLKRENYSDKKKFKCHSFAKRQPKNKN